MTPAARVRRFARELGLFAPRVKPAAIAVPVANGVEYCPECSFDFNGCPRQLCTGCRRTVCTVCMVPTTTRCQACTNEEVWP